MIGHRRVDAVTKFSKPLLLSVAALGATLLTAGRPAAADEHMTLVDKIAVPPASNVSQSTCSLGTGLGAFDISFVDPKSGFYVLADRTNAAVDFFDASDNVGPRRGFQGVGVTSPATETTPYRDLTEWSSTGKEVWAGDGDSTLKVIDIATFSLTDN